MRCKMFKYTAIIIFVSMAFFAAMAGDREITGSHDYSGSSARQSGSYEYSGSIAKHSGSYDYSGSTARHGDSHDYSGSGATHRSRDMARGTAADNTSQKLDGGNSLRAGVPDGLLASESRLVSNVRSGRTEAGTAEYLVILMGIFLSLSAFYFLLDGRPWSAAQSICMEFQGYAMRQIHILQLRDGKKRLLSYSKL